MSLHVSAQLSIVTMTRYTAHKMKFSITDLFNKCDQIRRSHLQKKSVIENFIFCAVLVVCYGATQSFFRPQPSNFFQKRIIYFLKKILIFWKRKTLKNSLYFKKRNFLILQETQLSYISRKIYSETQYIQSQKHIQKPGIYSTQDIFIFRTLPKNRYQCIFLYFQKLNFTAFPSSES